MITGTCPVNKLCEKQLHPRLVKLRLFIPSIRVGEDIAGLFQLVKSANFRSDPTVSHNVIEINRGGEDRTHVRSLGSLPECWP